MITDSDYEQYSKTVYRYLMSLTHNENIAEELTQETFYQAVRSADRFDGSCKVSTWLCAIAKRVLQTYLRKHPQTEELFETYASPDSPEDFAVEREQRLELLKKLNKLDPVTKELMYLRIFGDLSFKEIGEVMSISENRARVTFFRGKEKLKKEMTDHGK